MVTLKPYRMYEYINQHILGSEVAGQSPNPVLMAAVTVGTPPEHLPHCTAETIRERAETMTPLLKEILEHWPAEHWGINE
jgi:hypothetical protein